jgi:hypothetical protein
MPTNRQKKRASSPQRGVQQQPPQPAPRQQQAQQRTGAGAMDFQPVYDLVKKDVHPKLDAIESLMGFPVLAYFLDEGAMLGDEQMEHLYEHLRRIKRQPRIALWVHSRGGATEVPWKIVSLLREFADWFAVLLPYRAHSAATHLALGANEIVATEMTEMGPVDPTRRHPLLPKEEKPVPVGSQVAPASSPIPISVQDLRHVLDFVKREMGEDLSPDAAARVYTALFDKVHPLAIGALEQSWALANQVTERVLSTHMDPKTDGDKIAELCKRLSDHYKSHLYPISRREAKEMGLPVRDASPDEAKAMWDLFLAYRGLQIAGDGEINGKPAALSRLGHMDSNVGTSVGLQLASKTDPNQKLGFWGSSFSAAP